MEANRFFTVQQKSGKKHHLLSTAWGGEGGGLGQRFLQKEHLS